MASSNSTLRVIRVSNTIMNMPEWICQSCKRQQEERDLDYSRGKSSASNKPREITQRQEYEREGSTLEQQSAISLTSSLPNGKKGNFNFKFEIDFTEQRCINSMIQRMQEQERKMFELNRYESLKKQKEG